MTTPNNTVAGLAEKWRKKPVVVEAVQWFKLGDHPAVSTAAPDCPDAIDKGWIDTLEGGHYVTPGDWIITGVQGEHYPCKPDIFAATYEPAEALASPAPSAGVVTVEMVRKALHYCPLDMSAPAKWKWKAEYLNAALQHPAAPSAPDLLDQISKLQAFKDYVHGRLDDAGIPSNPGGQHTDAGCRIGDRLDIALSPPSAPPTVAGDAGELPELLDSIADDTRGHSLNGEQHDGLRNAANLIRRLATAEQPGSAVQGEAVTVETVGFVRKNGDGDLYVAWTPEGGIHELGEGCELVASATKLTDDTGIGEVYTTPPPAPAAVAHTCDFADGLDADCPACHPPAAEQGAMDERGRPLTYWGGLAQPEARGVEGMVLVPRELLEDVEDQLVDLSNEKSTNHGIYREREKLHDADVLQRVRLLLAAAPEPVRVDDAFVRKILAAPLGETTIGNMVCTEVTADRLIPALRAALTAAMSGKDGAK